MFSPTSKQCIAFVEACYGEVRDDATWISELLDSAQGAFGDAGFGLCIARLQETAQRLEIVGSESRGRGAAALAALAEHTPGLPPEAVDALWGQGKPLWFVSRGDHGLLPSAERGLLEEFVAGRDVDLIGLVGEPHPGLYFTFVTLVDGVAAMRGRKADTLHRLRLHLESGLRLRHGDGKVVAWLTPDGRLAHAEGEAKEKELRAALSKEVAAIERSRSPSAVAREAVRALTLWRALCAGRFSLVQRVDTDGKRHYAVIENAPAARKFRALSANEARVLDYTLKGLVGKHVAYALGLSEGYVSECLAAAAQKTGCRGKAELIRIATQLLGSEGTAIRGCLTATEAAVFELVRAGKTNREIAGLRRVSAFTVANQVGSILRKTGAPSRRALMTL